MTSVLPLAGSWFLRSLHATLRIRHVGLETIDSTPQYLLAFWHAQLLLMLHARYRKPITALVSQSRDGEIIAQVFDHYGVESARGSSTRGGAAGLRELIRRAREGRNIAITPDGPKGPPLVAKDGIVLAAQATGLPILPVAFAAKKKSVLDRGTGWSFPILSPAPSTSTATRSRCRAEAMSKSGGERSSAR